ncbi:hypothetical protein KDX00_16055 [Cobetia amphilecti]|nr:hypothetical protein KDX00_16055 [Cobetia litoralis]
MARIIKISPTTIKKANEFIKSNHRHHEPTSNNRGRWALSALDENDEIVGVVIAANPLSHHYMDGTTIELTRVCTIPSAPKGTCSFLLSQSCKVWRAMGGKKVLTYTLSKESGASLRGAGWILEDVVLPHNRWVKRTEKDGIARKNSIIYSLKKHRWGKELMENVQ